MTPADLALLEIDDLWKLRVLDHLHVDFDGPFSLLGMVIFQEMDNGLPAANRLSWYSAGVRPSWAFAEYFAVDLEVGVDYTSQDDGPNGTLVKATLAPQIRPKVSVLSRPSIRTFFTYAYWTGGFKGLIASRSYGDGQHGFVVGIQLETWW